MPKVTLQDLELPELITLREAAELLNCHMNTLRNWDRTGVLKAVRIGQRKDRRYKKMDIINLVNRRSR